MFTNLGRKKRYVYDGVVDDNCILGNEDGAIFLNKGSRAEHIIWSHGVISGRRAYTHQDHNIDNYDPHLQKNYSTLLADLSFCL